MDRKITMSRNTLEYLSNDELSDILRSSKYDTQTKRRASSVLRDRGVYG